MCVHVEQVYSSPVWRGGHQGEGLFSGRGLQGLSEPGTAHEAVGAVEAAQPWELGRRSGAGCCPSLCLLPGCCEEVAVTSLLPLPRLCC